MKKIIFFPGWPETRSLLEPFLEEMRKEFIAEIYNNHKREEGLIFISYSAGVIPLRLFAKKNDKMILISPAGLTNRGFFSHCYAFFRELLYTQADLAIKVWWESVKRITKKPLRSWREIREIRRYKLEINENDIIVLGENDLFMKTERKAIRIPGNHFNILENPKEVALIIKATL